LRLKNSLALLALSFIGCVTVPNVTVCSVAGYLSDCASTVGSTCAICAQTQTTVTSQLTFPQLLEFLEAQPATPTAPAHGAAIIISDADWSALETALEQACRELGPDCKTEVSQALNMMFKVRNRIQLKVKQ